jgi:hypothetical protein
VSFDAAVEVDSIDTASKSRPLGNAEYGFSTGVRGMLLLSRDRDGLDVGGDI